MHHHVTSTPVRLWITDKVIFFRSVREQVTRLGSSKLEINLSLARLNEEDKM